MTIEDRPTGVVDSLVSIIGYNKIAICGTPRTGTTLLQYLMRAFIPVLVIPGEVPTIIMPPLARYVNVVVVTKNPDDAFIASTVLATWPLTLFLFTKRDPRDILCSRIPETGEYPYGGDARRMLWFIRRNLEVRIGMEESVEGAIMVIRYEDLVTDCDKVQEQIAERTGLGTIYRFSEHHLYPDIPILNETFDSTRPVSSFSVGNWRKPEHREWMKSIVSRYGKELVYLTMLEGYEENGGWVEELE